MSIEDGKAVTLRPHHLLCLRTYVGKGYSRDFTENLDKIYSKLKSSPQTPIRLVFGADDVCSACPNLKSGICASEDKCDFLDRAVADASKIDEGLLYRWSVLCEKVEDGVIKSGEYLKLCSGCTWESVCAKLRK